MPSTRFPVSALTIFFLATSALAASPKLSFFERAPLEIGKAHAVSHDSTYAANGDVAWPAYRVQSFGGARLRLRARDLAPAADATVSLRVEGPLPEFGDAIPVGRGALVAEADDTVTVTLREAGIYRIVAGPSATIRRGELPPRGAKIQLESECLEKCFRAEMTPEALFNRLGAERLGRLERFAETQIRRHVNEPELQAAIGNEWRRLIEGRRFAALGRFPVLPPLFKAGSLRPLLGNLGAAAPAPDAVVRGELATLLAAGRANRLSVPGPVHPELPEVGYGHFVNNALPRAILAQSPVIAQILTSLAARNGSEITYEGRRLRTPEELVAALIETGHRIELRNERTYANFLSLTYDGKYLRWPVWLDTGLKLKDGSTFVTPSGHSQHAWRIHGPLVKARVMFYLGTSGAAFFPQIDERPAWTGLAALDGTESGSRAADAWILKSFEYAAKYLRRVRAERDTVAKGMPADGYGYLGICNDSNAVLELATRRTVTTYPLIRAKELLEKSRHDDGLDPIFEALPKDGDITPEMLESAAYRNQALCRALWMTPYPDDSPYFPDAALRAQVRIARETVGKTCRVNQGR